MTIPPCHASSGHDPRPAAATPAQPSPGDGQLDRVSRDFEAVLTATMLKQGLSQTSLRWDDGEEDQSANTFKDFAFEQIAHVVGRQGVLGISDRIKEQLRRLEEGNRNGHHARHPDR
jgi:Rod binding domain-containing protein